MTRRLAPAVLMPMRATRRAMARRRRHTMRAAIVLGGAALALVLAWSIAR
jgi:hypothetical protein